MDKNKSKFVPFHAMIVRSGDVAVIDTVSLMPNLACVWMKLVSFKFHPLYPRELNPRYRTKRMFCEPEITSGGFGDENVKVMAAVQGFHKSVKHLKNSQQIHQSTNHGSSYADRERNSPSFLCIFHRRSMCSPLVIRQTFMR